MAKSPIRKVREKHVKELAAWLKKNGEKAKIPGLPVKTIHRGDVRRKQAYRIPREYLYLNDANHRFTTDWDNLKKDRKGKEFDPEDDEDIEQIEDVIKGEGATDNKVRRQKFKDLVDGMRVAAKEVSGSNGQEIPGIVLTDGTYINGNRRAVALEELKDELLKDPKSKKGGVRTNHFDWIMVAICDSGTTESDIRRMELREQVSEDLRDPYDFMNAAMLTTEEFDDAFNKKIRPSMSGKKRANLKETVIKDIAAQAAGLKVSKINDYLEFMNFVDDVLAAMNRDGQYHIVNQSSGSEKPFSYKLKDALNDWKSKSPRRAQLAYANSMAMSVVVHQKITKSGGIPRGAKGYRQFRYALGSKKFGNIIRTATDKFDFNKPDKSAKAAAKSINDAIRKNEIETTARSPTETLEDVKDKILNAAEELTKGDTEKKFQVLVKNKDLIDDISTTCDQINTLIRKYERGQRKSKRGGKRSKKKGRKR